MRFILKFIQIIICLYLAFFAIIKAFFISQESFYENEYPSIKGYSLYKIKDDNLSPDLKKNDYVVLQSQEEYKKGDIVFTIKKQIGKVKEISFEDAESFDEQNILLVDNKNNESNVSRNKVYGKVIYNNKTVSTILHIFTHPIAILVLIIIAVSISSRTYKRY